jgi:hydroxymethylglutaryl-CoA lyase
MADTMEVINQLDYLGSRSNIMVLAVNTRGAELISTWDPVTEIAYPFSFCPTFLKLNLNSTIEKSFQTVKEILEICQRTNKTTVIYISMAYGNPYGDEWSQDLLMEWTGKLADAGVKKIALSNVSIEISESLIEETFSSLIPAFPDIDLGMHLHTAGNNWYKKIESAYSSGCRRFDAVIDGWGGCPMTGKELLGNLRTQDLVSYFSDNNIRTEIDMEAFRNSCRMASEIFTDQ